MNATGALDWCLLYKSVCQEHGILSSHTEFVVAYCPAVWCSEVVSMACGLKSGLNEWGIP